MALESKQKLQCSMSHGTIIHINNKACNSTKQIRHGQYLFARQQLLWGWGGGGGGCGGTKQDTTIVTSIHNITRTASDPKSKMKYCQTLHGIATAAVPPFFASLLLKGKEKTKQTKPAVKAEGYLQEHTGSSKCNAQKVES